MDLHSLVSCRISTDGEQLQFALKKGYGLLGGYMNYVFSSSYVTSKTKDREMPFYEKWFMRWFYGLQPSLLHEYVNTEENREAILCFSSNRGGPIVTHDIVGRKTGIFVFRDTFLAASSACKHRIEECWPGKYSRDENLLSIMFGFPTPVMLHKAIYYFQEGERGPENEKPLVWFQAGRGLSERVLAEGETLDIRGSRLCAWEDCLTVEYTSKHEVHLHKDIFGFVLRGPGKVWLSTSSRSDYWQSLYKGHRPLDSHYNTPTLTTVQILTVLGTLILITYVIAQAAVNLNVKHHL